VRRRLHGYTLLELTVAGSVAAVVTAGALLTLQFNERMTAGKIVAEHMLRLSAAVVRYKELYHKELTRLPPICGQSSYAVGLSKAGPDLSAVAPARPLCSVERRGSPAVFMDNGLQPSVADLQAFGLLESGFDPRLVLPLMPAVPVKRADTSGAPSTLDAPAEFGILIAAVCLESGASTLLPPTPPSPHEPDPCGFQASGGHADLVSTVFNIRPYDVGGDRFGSGARLGAMLQALGGQGFMAQLGSDGQLRAYKGQSVLPNPVTAPTLNGAAGLPGIVAAHHRSVPSEFTMRDGSNPPTQDWNFANRALNHVSTLGVDGLATLGSVKVGNNLSVSGNAEVDGDVTIEGAAAVTGRVVMTGGASLYGASSVEHLGMRSIQSIGDACSTRHHSFAQDDQNLEQLMMCHNTKWVRIAAATPAAPPPPAAPQRPGFHFRLSERGFRGLLRFEVIYRQNGSTYSAKSPEYSQTGATWSWTPDASNQQIVLLVAQIHAGQNGWVSIMRRPLDDDLYRTKGKCYNILSTAYPFPVDHSCN